VTAELTADSSKGDDLLNQAGAYGKLIFVMRPAARG
jgi:hypothetical protein